MPDRLGGTFDLKRVLWSYAYRQTNDSVCDSGWPIGCYSHGETSSEDTLEERSVNGIPMASKRKEGQREQLLNSVFGIYVLHIDTK